MAKENADKTRTIAALVRSSRSCASLALISACLAYCPEASAIRCNTKAGTMSEEASLPAIGGGDQFELATIAQDDPTLTADEARDLRMRATLDLGKDLTSLDAMTGPLIENTPVLMVRLENLPNFDLTKNCNMVFPVVGKPRIERLGDNRVRATLGRFTITFSADAPPAAWLHDAADATGRIFWIFPRVFGRGHTNAWELTRNYAATFQKAPEGSVKRAWIAEAYLDLAMRTYRGEVLGRPFPIGDMPTRASLDQRFATHAGVACDDQSNELICLAARLLEINEVGHPRTTLSRDVFRATDAIYESSGVTTGLQQLDVATDDDAKRLMPRWMPSTIGKFPQYRRRIRLWTVDDLTRWYGTDGPAANEELSRPEIKEQILDSYVDLFIGEKKVWEPRIAQAYPAWKPEWRTALALLGIDIKNVTGYSLFLPPAAGSICEVLTSEHRRTIEGNISPRYNSMFLSDVQIRPRIKAGIGILKAKVAFKDIDWSCVEAEAAPNPPVQDVN